jgi:hypothetical protein
MPYMKLQYPTYVKDIDLDAHIRVLKKAIKINGERMEVDIINLFGFTLRDNIFEWGENYVQNHPNYIFEKLEQTFCKQFIMVKNDKEVTCNCESFNNKSPNMLKFIMNTY